ncbi:hypothetical protein TNCT_591631 [Trichonephila clavata]|uniref:Uncharacterized protein n=1 Tax=Trichonephila clavata TaxID=2740835 RepID=A0A8X6FTQ0_TRICU|nr:hypothetical protein TNCT_591631 [Trichonephila clavata]
MSTRGEERREELHRPDSTGSSHNSNQNHRKRIQFSRQKDKRSLPSSRSEVQVVQGKPQRSCNIFKRKMPSSVPTT